MSQVLVATPPRRRIRRWLVALLVALFGGLSLIYSASQTPRYEATATVQISPAPLSEDLTAALEEFGPNSEFVATQAGLIRSRTLAERVVEEEGLSLPPLELSESISAEVVKGTRLVKVSITDPDAAFARRLVTAVVETYVAGGLVGTEQVHADIIDSALSSSRPVSPQPLRDGLFGAGAGLVFGLLLSLVRPRVPEEIDSFGPSEPEAWLPPAVDSETEVFVRTGEETRESLWVEEDAEEFEEDDEEFDDAEEEELETELLDEEKWSEGSDAFEEPEAPPASIPDMQLEPDGASFSEFWDRTRRRRRRDRG